MWKHSGTLRLQLLTLLWPGEVLAVITLFLLAALKRRELADRLAIMIAYYTRTEFELAPNLHPHRIWSHRICIRTEFGRTEFGRTEFDRTELPGHR